MADVSAMTVKTVSTTISGFEDFDRCTRQRFLALDRESGAISLVRRICLSDEVGRCTARDREVVTDRIWAKKEFFIVDPQVFDATLALRVECEVARGARIEEHAYIDTDPRPAKLLIEVNGHTISFSWPKERDYWEGCAFPIDIPLEYLRPGLNEFVFHSADSLEWYLLIEDSLWPNRSAKSVDAGTSWDYEHLGVNGGHDGEYLLRLQLEGYPSQGVLTSPALDLATLASGERTGVPFTLKGIKIESEAESPAGTGMEFQIRGGSTPSYEPFQWTKWLPLDEVASLVEASPRFVQWRAILTTESPRLTPVLMGVTLEADVEVAERQREDRFEIAADHTPTIARSSYHFAYQPHEEERLRLPYEHERVPLRLVRERWGLDEVVEGAESELEELVRLCAWTRRQWENGWNEGGELKYCPPWDGLVVRELASRGLALGMCTHYSTVFVQACLALGFLARHNVIQAHCVAEVWSNEFQKWAMFDPGCDMDDKVKGTYHLEREGIPLSTLEAHQAWLAKDFERTQMVPQLYKPRFSLDAWLRHFERFCITLREDDLTSLSAGEPEHGWGSYHFDRYLWWEDEETPKMEWFTLATDRVADMYWGVNQVEVHLVEAEERDSILVTLDTETPNFATYQVKFDNALWREAAGEFLWQLHPGENRLAVRSVNRFGRTGPEASLTINLLM